MNDLLLHSAHESTDDEAGGHGNRWDVFNDDIATAHRALARPGLRRKRPPAATPTTASRCPALIVNSVDPRPSSSSRPAHTSFESPLLPSWMAIPVRLPYKYRQRLRG